MTSFWRYYLAVNIAAASIAFIAWYFPAHSQELQKSSLERALGIRIGNEINSNLTCNAENIGLRDQLLSLQTEVKRLTEKYEPKKDEPKLEPKKE